MSHRSPAVSLALFRRSPAVRTAALPAAALLAASAWVLSACASPPAAQSPVPSSSAPAAQSPATEVQPPSSSQPAPTRGTSYPLTVDNCGTDITFTAAPSQVVTAKSSTTEALLALGLGKTIVATSFPDGPLPTWLEGENVAAVATPLSSELPSLENVLELSPDLVYVGWESNLSADGIGPRETFTQLGVNTYIAPSACKEPQYQPRPLTYDHVFGDIAELGQIFDVTEAAEELITQQRGQLTGVVPDTRGLTALWFSSGSKTPFVGGSIGSAQLAMDTIGLNNIGAEIDDSWGPMSWEKVIEADPDVIVLVDSAWGSTEKKIGVLKDNPVTAQLTAVVNERYLVVPFPATEAGVRSVSAAVELSDQLAALDMTAP